MADGRKRPGVVVVRVRDAWLVVVGRRGPHWFQRFYWPLLMARWIDSKGYMHCIPKLKRILKDRHNRARHGSAG